MDWRLAQMATTTEDRPALARPDEIARALNCSRSKVYELLQRDEIPGKVVIGSSIRVHRATFERWLEGLAGQAAI
jgi:excisionase family DNA binding protein